MERFFLGGTPPWYTLVNLLRAPLYLTQAYFFDYVFQRH